MICSTEPNRWTRALAPVVVQETNSEVPEIEKLVVGVEGEALGSLGCP